MKSTVLKILSALFIVGSGLMALGCSSANKSSTPLHHSKNYYNYIQPSFAEYEAVTRQWLANNRNFISQDREQELVMNSPYTRGDKNADKAILLVHGLGDSPFSFVDISESLAKQGFYVQVLLLPGHGSAAKHMQQVQYEDWQTIVDHYANLLKKQYKQVWLGGFSTGGNLVSIHAIDNDNISGLMLFSPGFKTVTPILEKFTPIVALFTDGWEAQETNFAKYNSAPIHSALVYSKSATILRKKLAKQAITVPTLMVVSEADSVIDAQALLDYFQQGFTHPQSQLIWYGEQDVKVTGQDIHTYSMRRDDLHISTGSHMSVLFAPNNFYYGEQGQKRICENGFNKGNTESCEAGQELWFSAWGYSEPGKVYARLTWNPYYSELEDSMSTITTIKG